MKLSVTSVFPETKAKPMPCSLIEEDIQLISRKPSDTHIKNTKSHENDRQSW
jgi:hypothetical protein